MQAMETIRHVANGLSILPTVSAPNADLPTMPHTQQLVPRRKELNGRVLAKVALKPKPKAANEEGEINTSLATVRRTASWPTAV